MLISSRMERNLPQNLICHLKMCSISHRYDHSSIGSMVYSTKRAMFGVFVSAPKICISTQQPTPRRHADASIGPQGPRTACQAASLAGLSVPMPATNHGVGSSFDVSSKRTTSPLFRMCHSHLTSIQPRRLQSFHRMLHTRAFYDIFLYHPYVRPKSRSFMLAFFCNGVKNTIEAKTMSPKNSICVHHSNDKP
jgi:hypothetical protein